MATSAINATGVNDAIKSAGLSMDDLLKLLLTELTYQDPMKPVENKDFLAQMAQFSSLDTTRQLNENIQSMLSLQSLNQSVGLLGKTVDALTDTTSVSGTVTALNLSTGQPLITVKTAAGETIANIGLGQIQNVR
ncbi:MAG: flagellar hook capping protein [Aquabacterium sp.]|nr:MAG: flagellar hook capping protein [Aquabacterium sp.]